jgi:hypothetical protein
MRPHIVGILGHAQVSLEEFSEYGFGGFEGGLGGVWKPQVKAVEENWSDVGPEELKNYCKGKILDAQSIAHVSDPSPGLSYCRVQVIGEGELGGEGETDIVQVLDDFNRTIVVMEGGGRQTTFMENHGYSHDGIDLKAVPLGSSHGAH